MYTFECLLNMSQKKFKNTKETAMQIRGTIPKMKLDNKL